MMDWTAPVGVGRLTYEYVDQNGDTVTCVAERVAAPDVTHESGYGALGDRASVSFRMFAYNDQGHYLQINRTDGPVSKAAKAIYASRCEMGAVQNPTSWDGLSQKRRDYYRTQAEAALAAAGCEL